MGGKRLIPVTCTVCDNVFKPKWGKINKYCSHDCYWTDMKNRRGEKSSAWKGESDYGAVHKWISKNWIKPDFCEFCGNNVKLQWANISGTYIRDPRDWIALCVSCHHRWDRNGTRAWQSRKGKYVRVCSLDFDGVLHKYSLGWHDGSIYDEPVKDSVKMVLSLVNNDIECEICTVRTIEQWKDIAFWLYRNGFPGMRISNIKKRATVYVDDRCIRFTNWNDMLKYFI